MKQILPAIMEITTILSILLFIFCVELDFPIARQDKLLYSNFFRIDFYWIVGSLFLPVNERPYNSSNPTFTHVLD